MVYLESSTRQADVLSARKTAESFLLEQQYQRFFSWWQENRNAFSTLSFNIDNQSNQFIGDLGNGLSFKDAFSKIRADLWGYYLEYIKQEAFLPFTNKIKNGRLVGDFYGDKPIVDLVNEEEREGATKRAMEDLEKKLISLSDGQMIFRVSPKGWTNMGHDYTETQFQIFWKEGELVRGLTIRTGVDLERVVQLFKERFQIDVDGGFLNEKELLKKITEMNIVLPNFLEEIVYLIAQFSDGRDHQGRDLLPQFERWRLNDGNYQRYDQLVSLLSFLEERIKEVYNLWSNNEVAPVRLKGELESLLAFVLMIMAEKERLEKGNSDWRVVRGHQFSIDTRYAVIDPRQLDQTLSYLTSLPGCAGGGQSEKTSIFDRFKLTPFGTIKIDTGDSERYPDYQCPSCGKTIQGEKKDHPEEWKKECPYCHTPLNCGKEN